MLYAKKEKKTHNDILEGTHRGFVAPHPSPALTHGKMRGKERRHLRALLFLLSPLTPGSTQSPYLVEDGVAGSGSCRVSMTGTDERMKMTCRAGVTDSEVGAAEVFYNKACALDKRAHTCIDYVISDCIQTHLFTVSPHMEFFLNA